MLMRNPEYQVETTQVCLRHTGEIFAVRTPREMFLGQSILILLFVIAILLQAMT